MVYSKSEPIWAERESDDDDDWLICNGGKGMDLPLFTVTLGRGFTLCYYMEL